QNCVILPRIERGKGLACAPPLLARRPGRTARASKNDSARERNQRPLSKQVRESLVMRRVSALLPSVIALLLAAAGSGCAEERPPINRVQANALDKAFFVGDLADETDNPTFYARAFVIDESAGQNGLSVGLYSGTDRIKWEITEDVLIAHKAYQIVQGQDDHGLPSGPPNGVVVAKYKIESHFDIKRAYHPTTGEEMNVIQ